MPAFLANLFSVEELQIIAGKANKVKNQQKLHRQCMVLGEKEKERENNFFFCIQNQGG